mgnify:CR=1 FL=1
MKVYTVQPVDFLQSVDSEGFIYPRNAILNYLSFSIIRMQLVHFIGLKKSIRNEFSYHWIEI